MEYKIVGDVMQALQLQLHQGEQVYAEAGTMLYMGQGIELQAKMRPRWDRTATNGRASPDWRAAC